MDQCPAMIFCRYLFLPAFLPSLCYDTGELGWFSAPPPSIQWPPVDWPPTVLYVKLPVQKSCCTERQEPYPPSNNGSISSPTPFPPLQPLLSHLKLEPTRRRLDDKKTSTVQQKNKKRNERNEDKDDRGYAAFHPIAVSKSANVHL